MADELDGKRPRNQRLVDAWSLVHLLAPMGLALVLAPFWALAIAVLWEPLEVLVLSPLLGRAGIDFGHESLQNTLVDQIFNVAGVALGAYVVAPRLGLAPWF